MNDNLQQTMIDAVSEDPNRETFEKETAINFAKPDDRATITATTNGIMRRLLAHDDFELKWIQQSSNGSLITVTADELEEKFDGRRPVVTVVGTIPVGCLKVQRNSRATGGQANVVASPKGGDE